MTISSNDNKRLYDGDGSTAVFDVPFKFLAANHIRAVLRDAAGVETVWTQGSQYTLTGAGQASGGTLTVITSPTDYTPQSGQKLLIKRVVPLTQETDFPEGGVFPAAAAENAHDLGVMAAQQQQEELDRTITFAETSAVTGVTLPDPDAGKFVGWNAGATDLENKDLQTLGVVAVPLAVADGGTDATTAAGARANLAVPGLADANLFTADQTLRSTEDGVESGPDLIMDRASPTPAAFDTLGAFVFKGRNDLDEVTDYGALAALIFDPADGAEVGRLALRTAVAGALGSRLLIEAGVFTPGAVGGDQGADALNAVRHHVGAVFWSAGAGSPEGAVTAPVGSLYSRTDGGAGTSLYIKESGSGNTGWVGK